jgi:hypothetical protein
VCCWPVTRAHGGQAGGCTIIDRRLFPTAGVSAPAALAAQAAPQRQQAAAAALFEPAVERIEIPYESAKLTGWFFRVDASRRRRPLVILNTGADGLENSRYVLGGAGALARGYNCLIFNGPGQGDSLWLRKLHFRPDWERAITPVIDLMVHHVQADSKRIAAGVADPGVSNVADAWLRNLPTPIRQMLDAGKQSEFDQVLGMGAATDPEGEQFFPGQAQKLFDQLRCPKALVRLTREQGAEQHCEVNAPGYRDYCICNWLDET